MKNSLTRILKLADVMLQNQDTEALERLCTHFQAFVERRVKVAHMVPENDGTTPNPWKRNMDYAGYENSPYFGSVSDFLKKFPNGIRDWVEWRRKTQKERNKMWDTKNIKERTARLESLMKTAEDEENALKEELSDLEHDQWAHWTKYMLENLSDENKEKWEKQIKTDYKDLTEKEKDSDREWAGKVLKIIEKHKELKVEAHFVPVGPDDTKKFKNEPHLYSGDMDKFKDIKDFIKKHHRHMRGNDASDGALEAVNDFIAYWQELKKGKNRRKNKKSKAKK